MFRKTCLMIGVLAAALVASMARSDDKPADKPKPDQAAIAEQYMKMARPGAEHQRLKDVAGEWDADSKFWNPDGSTSASKGVMHARMILGDRYLQLNYEGQADMGNGPLPFKGMGIGGYDRVKKKYTNVWVDEMSTGMMITEGTCDGN